MQRYVSNTINFLFVINYKFLIILISIKNIELTEIQILNKKRENSKLDRKIQHLNLDLTEQNMARDMYMEKREYKQRKER